MLLQKRILTFLIFFYFSFTYSQEIQSNIDSLLVVLKSAKKDTAKVMLYQKIASHYNVTNLDSAKAFAQKGIRLSDELDFSFGKMMNLNVLGNFYERKTEYETALKTYDKALKIAEKTKSQKGLAVVLNNIAMVQTRKGNYEIALEGYFEALKAEEKLGNENGIAQCYNNIGVVYYYLKNFYKTTEYLIKALKIQERLGNLDGLQNGYNNVGAIYEYQKKFDDAIASYSKALEISQKLGDTKQEAACISNIALSYSNKGDFVKAEALFKKATKIRDSIKDYNGMSNSYIAFGQMFLEQNKFSDAQKYYLEGIALSEKHNLKITLREGYAGLSDLAEKQNDYKTAHQYLQKYIVIKDSILSEKNTASIAEVEIKYETEKKENQILQQQYELEKKEQQVKRKNTLIFGSFGLAFLLGLLGYLFYNQQKLQNRQLKKEVELQTALAKIEAQNQLQEQRLHISRDLHDNIGAQLTFIISSIDNIKYGYSEIGEKLSTKLAGISAFTSQTIYELRDTIWAMNKSSITFEDLQARISNFIEKAKSASEKTSFSFEIEKEVDQNHLFSSVEGMNIYRIIQESVNNAIKYSEASTINVLISEYATSTGEMPAGQRGAFQISISDNGKGFDLKETEMGNGLSNMKKRAREIKGSLEIGSGHEKGTEVKLQLPIKKPTIQWIDAWTGR